MSKFSAYPLLAQADLDPDDYMVFASGSSTYKVKLRNVLGAISALTEPTEAQQTAADTVFTNGGVAKIGPFSDIASLAEGLRQMPLNQFRWGLHGASGSVNFHVWGLMSMSGAGSGGSPGATNATIPMWEGCPTALNEFHHRSFEDDFLNLGIPAYLKVRARLAQLDNCRFTVGFAQILNSADTSSSWKYAGLWYKSSESPNIQLMCGDGSTVERVDTGVVMDTLYHTWEVAFAEGQVLAFRDGVHIATNETVFPISGNVYAHAGICALEAVPKLLCVDYMLCISKR